MMLLNEMLDLGAHDTWEYQLLKRALWVRFHNELLPGLRYCAAPMQGSRCSATIELNGAQQSICKGCMLLGPLLGRQCLNGRAQQRFVTGSAGADQCQDQVVA